MHPKTTDAAPGLLVQFLDWIAVRPRTYQETMDAWRTSCPRISVWEDALIDGLVAAEDLPADTQGDVRIILTPAGIDHLKPRALMQQPAYAKALPDNPGANVRAASVIVAQPAPLEQHHPDWNSRGDKVARSNRQIQRADCFQSAHKRSNHYSQLALVG